MDLRLLLHLRDHTFSLSDWNMQATHVLRNLFDQLERLAEWNLSSAWSGAGDSSPSREI